MINTAIFDLSEVYLHGIKGLGAKLGSLLKVPDQIAYNSMGGEDLSSLFKGEITEDEYWRRYLQKNHFKTSSGKLKQLVRAHFSEIEGTRGIIEELKQREYKLGLLSIHAREWIEYCQGRFDYHKLFDSVSYSFQTGICKPDKRAYEIILAQLCSKPEESLFIDDQERNLVPVRSLGMKAIRFIDSRQLKKELSLILN